MVNITSNPWLQQHGGKIVAISLWAFFAWCFVSGMTDIDWMVTDYYWDMWNSRQEFYTFSPGFTMAWWDAYIYTITRIVVGSGGLGVMIYKAVFKR